MSVICLQKHKNNSIIFPNRRENQRLTAMKEELLCNLLVMGNQPIYDIKIGHVRSSRLNFLKLRKVF